MIETNRFYSAERGDHYDRVGHNIETQRDKKMSKMGVNHAEIPYPGLLEEV